MSVPTFMPISGKEVPESGSADNSCCAPLIHIPKTIIRATSTPIIIETSLCVICQFILLYIPHLCQIIKNVKTAQK
jgi:hypothetical protein